MTIEKVSQEEMLSQFRDRYAKLVEDNRKMAAQIKENEVQALKLQGAIETLEYYNQQEETASHPPEEVDEVTAE